MILDIPTLATAFLMAAAFLAVTQWLPRKLMDWLDRRRDNRKPAPIGNVHPVTPEPLKTGGLPGWHEERARILEAFRLIRPELKQLRQDQRELEVDCPTLRVVELDDKLAEYADYSRRLKDVDEMIEEESR